jgi:4-hydroxythreonine-4-phosphate dehydrogenase
VSSSSLDRRPLIALTLGDPAGIGPEIALAATKDERVRAAMRLLLIGPECLRPAILSEADAAWSVSDGDGSWRAGHVQASSGRAALSALRIGAELAAQARVQALVTAPVSKAALHLAGERVEGQTELLARWAGVERYQMVAVAHELRIMLATRHMPLARAIASLDAKRIADLLVLFDESLRSIGIERPRLALAGLNPHAGEGGLLGDEEEEILDPALAMAADQGVTAAGPLSPDSVFGRARAGEFDGVLALYHDQAFIPIKLIAEQAGFTWIAGLPYLRLSPVHGTAFDLVGTGRASPENLIRTLLVASAWSARRTELESAQPSGR